jgi:two-component system, NtrC family, nitrogen regulation response regulator GlnG
VLSDGHFYRVGGHSPIKANVRVIAATHQTLEQRVKDGLFREDLFHRLNVIRLRLPRLTERNEDVPLLARSFLQKSAKELGTEPKRISDAAMSVLQAYAFPGNVRELENICHWLTVMAPAQVVEVKDLPSEVLGNTVSKSVLTSAMPRMAEHSADHVASAASAGHSWDLLLAEEARSLLKMHSPEVMDQLTKRFEAALIRTALEVTKGRRIEASQRLGIGRNTITRKIQELNLDAEDE